MIRNISNNYILLATYLLFWRGAHERKSGGLPSAINGKEDEDELHEFNNIALKFYQLNLAMWVGQNEIIDFHACRMIVPFRVQSAMIYGFDPAAAIYILYYIGKFTIHCIPS